MSEKLSERLERFEFSDELGNGDFSVILEAAAIVRAVELAPACIVECVCDFDESEQAVLNVLVKNGKRVKLVEVK